MKIIIKSARSLALGFAIILFATFPTMADPQKDADYIVEQTVTRAMFEGAILSMRPVLISAITNDLRQKNIEVSDMEGFFDIFVEEFIDEFTAGMRSETANLYLELFSPEELADLAEFYKSPTGQKLVEKTPILMQASAQLGAKVGERAGENAGKRVAKRLEQEGIVLNNDKSLTQKIIDALR